MIINVLVENTTISEQMGCEHGFSLFIETKKHKILFDTGASNLFADNAKKMHIDLSQVDIVFISHGHYDHGGGLKTFLEINQKAKIYIQKQAFGDFFACQDKENKYIGLDKNLADNERFIFLDDEFVLDDEVYMFSGVLGRQFFPSGNGDLHKKFNGKLIKDDFVHEQNLVIKEDGKVILFAGCCHNGIVNIMQEFYKKYLVMPDYVVGGLHLYNPGRKVSEEKAVVEQIGHFLLESKAIFYTGHCTGIECYGFLKNLMQDKVHYLATGRKFIL